MKVSSGRPPLLVEFAVESGACRTILSLRLVLLGTEPDILIVDCCVSHHEAFGVTLPDGSLHPTEKALLDELGDLDPAVSQEENAENWVTLVDQSGEWVRVRPSEGEWSALEILAHLTVGELVNSLRYRAMLVEESPRLVDYGTEFWSSVLKAPGAAPLALLEMFGALRRDNLKFWRNLDAAGRARIGVHPECGPESIEMRFRMAAGHDAAHMAQARRAVAAARANRAT
jgi:hypothetical protein